MKYKNIPFKSYCWSLGTTSFRTKNFNLKIETQLSLLNEFWSNEANKGKEWNENTQVNYYNFMKSKKFVEGDAPKKAKDAREKTSGLFSIGLISEDRRLTKVGTALLDISESGMFDSNNAFDIDRDSYIYLKQMLKTSIKIENEKVRPFIVLLYLLDKLQSITLDEFTYLLPLCVNETTTNLILANIIKVRSKNITIDTVIVDTLLSMQNYKDALELFLENSVDEELICTIGFNRKSRKYDTPYFPLYMVLKEVFLNSNTAEIRQLYKATNDVSVGKYWRDLLFDTTSKKSIDKNPSAHLKQTDFSKAKNETELKKLFFKYMHLFKAKANLADYSDLNKRYIKNTDIVIFEDSNVRLDIIPKYFFNTIMQELFSVAFTESSNLTEDCDLIEIHASLDLDEQKVIDAVQIELGISVRTSSEARKIIEDERYRRLKNLIDTRFTDEKLIHLLSLFEKRADSEISELVTDNADIPTIFEYILGIIWYKVSKQQGKILDYMKLSLEVDLLPKTHAGGGEADIVYEYEKTDVYPQHCLLIEATLANSTTQRSMEMEPVSRHLGQHLLRTGNLKSYCLFSTNYLNINVVSDFRNNKTKVWYDTSNHSKFIEGMKIIPLQTSELKSIIENRLTYQHLYPLFEDAFMSDMPAHLWYKEKIEEVVK